MHSEQEHVGVPHAHQLRILRTHWVTMASAALSRLSAGSSIYFHLSLLTNPQGPQNILPEIKRANKQI